MVTIAFTNQKGGTGKSTTAHALGAGLTLKGNKVLLVDLDAQGNLTYTAGASTRGKTIADLLQQAIDGKTPDTLGAIQQTRQGDIIASNPNLAAADTILTDVTGREYKLKEILTPVNDKYDFCILDTPPTLGTLTVNALTAADMVIAPAQADVYSLLAIGQLHSTITTVKKYCNPGLAFSGIVITRYNGRAVISREVAERIGSTAAQTGTKVYNTRIRECTAIKEAEIMQTNIFEYAPRSNAAKDYTALLEEILQDVKKIRTQKKKQNRSNGHGK